MMMMVVAVMAAMVGTIDSDRASNQDGRQAASRESGGRGCKGNRGSMNNMKYDSEELRGIAIKSKCGSRNCSQYGHHLGIFIHTSIIIFRY